MHERRRVLIEFVSVLRCGLEKHNVVVCVCLQVGIYLYVFITFRFYIWPSPSAHLAKLVTS